MPESEVILCGPVAIEAFALLAVMLLLKHLLADGPLQTKYQLENKGKFLHPGGLVHVGIHVGLTGVCLVVWLVWADADLNAAAVTATASLLVVELVVHYFTDLSKVKLEKRCRWSSAEYAEGGAISLKITSPYFFFSFLTDQTIHSLTYVWIVYYASNTLLSGPGASSGTCAMPAG